MTSPVLWITLDHTNTCLCGAGGACSSGEVCVTVLTADLQNDFFFSSSFLKERSTGTSGA